jgi:hypothetical protein
MSGSSSSGAQEVKKEDEEGENKIGERGIREELEAVLPCLKGEDDAETAELLRHVAKDMGPHRPHSPGRTRSRSPVRDSHMHDILDLAKGFLFDEAITALKSRIPDDNSDIKMRQLVNMSPLGRWTILHQAAFAGSTSAVDKTEALRVIARLIEMGADPSVVAGHGETPKDWT